jgi:hypothetical protein
MYYLLDKDTLEIKASLRGKPNMEEIEKNNITAINSSYQYSPRKLKAIEKDGEINIEFRPEIKAKIKNTGNYIKVDAMVRREDGTVNQEINDELTITVEKYEDKEIITEKTLIINSGEGFKNFNIGETGRFVVRVKHDKFSEASDYISVKEVM